MPESVKILEKLPRRERQIIDILLSENDLSAAELQLRVGDGLTYSATRAALRVLVSKGVITHRYDGPRYVYRVTLSKPQARQAILNRVLATYFGGSREALLEALLFNGKVPSKELKKLARLIDRYRS